MGKIKVYFLFLLISVPFAVISQTDADYDLLNSLILDNPDEAYSYSRQKYEMAMSSKKIDTLYMDAILMHLQTIKYYEQYLRIHENFSKDLEINAELLDMIQKHKKLFNKRFQQEKYFAYRNLIVCHTGLGNYETAQEYRDILYKAQKKGKVPCEYELCNYFNFDFFTVDTLNVWGYEWYDKIPKDRFSQSFSKIVYYVYSTYPDGSDKDLLYMLHVLMFHGYGQPFDYIMEKQFSTDEGDFYGSMYSYTYNKDIDFKKLHNDVKEIVKHNKQTDTQRYIKDNEVHIEM